MSERVVCQAMVCDKVLMKDAFKDIGIADHHITFHESPITVHFKTDEHDVEIPASVVIKPGAIGNQRQICLELMEDGTYQVHMSSHDRYGAGAKLFKASEGGTGEFWQHYTKRNIMKTAKNLYGSTIQECTQEPDGRMKLRVSVQ